jgi:hypothetical protein
MKTYSNQIIKVDNYSDLPGFAESHVIYFIINDVKYYIYRNSVWEEIYVNFLAGGGLTISTTYAALLTSITNSTLSPGLWYNISYTINGDPNDLYPIDVYYDIYLLALDSNTLDLNQGKRIMSTPIYVSGTVEPWYPTSGQYVVGDRVIYCNRVWRNILDGIGSVQGIYTLNSTNWILETDPQYYEDIVYDISYSLTDQEVITQRDTANNIITGYSRIFTPPGNLVSPQNTIDISDWSYSDTIRDNSTYGMWNNTFIFSGMPGPGQISGNRLTAWMYNNISSRIQDNQCRGRIYDNQLTEGEISNNTAISIYNNNGNGSIENNHIGDLIHSNTYYNSIMGNTCSGSISDNTVIGIVSNSNSGNILLNSVPSGDISYNSNRGNIYGNTISGSSILNNDNLGYITSNEAYGILNNSNGGNIGFNITPEYIFGNSGPGQIRDNIITGNISYNICNNISDNISVGDIMHNVGGDIVLNQNSGDIMYNTISDKIENNTNNGHIKLNVCDSIYDNRGPAGEISNNKCYQINGNG